MDNEQNNTIIFLHIPKTAGTTLLHILQRQYGQNQCYFSGPNAQDFVQEYDQLTTVQKRNTRLAAGHVGYGFHKHIPNNSTYFTLLRDPVERVISFYHYVRDNEQHYLNRQAVQGYRDFKDFVESGITKMIDNAQTRLISGVWLEPEFGKCSTQSLELAKKNLRQNFSVVGLTAEFDATLLLLQANFHWRNIYYVRANVTKKRPAVTTLSTDELQAATAVNQLDIALYEYAQTLFAEQIARLGPDFPDTLQTFQRNNRRYNKLMAPVMSISQKVRKYSVRTAVRQSLRAFH